MGNTWSLQHVRTVPCVFSLGMCVSLKHRLVIVARYDGTLWMYSLDDGSAVCSIGSKGSGKGQFNFLRGGMCMSPDGDSVLVAESYNHRVQEVCIADGSWVRFVQHGAMWTPQYVDCNASVIAVSESSLVFARISVLSWRDGRVLAQFGSYGSDPGQLYNPHGVRLLADGSGLVIADASNSRLCVFSLAGEFVRALGSKERGFSEPVDVVECAANGSFVTTNLWGHNLVEISQDGEIVGVYGKEGSGDGEFDRSTALAALPDGGLVVLESGGMRFQVFAGKQLRSAWIRACVTLATREVCAEGALKRGRYGCA